MSNEILVNVTTVETRLALIEDGLLQELHIERQNNTGLVGNIYKGKVQRVLPGIQSAFIDIGLEKSGFIHLDDVIEKKQSDSDIGINDLLYEGQKLLVQVMKDPLGNKGPRLTTQITLSSRYLVYMPQIEHIAVSRQIEQENERQRLKTIVTELKKTLNFQGGFIVRTSAEGFLYNDLFNDAVFLMQLWESLKQSQKNKKKVSLIYKDIPAYMRIIRDSAKKNIARVQVDSKKTCKIIREFLETFDPDVTKKIDYYDGDIPLFDLYNIEDEIQRSLLRRVPLDSGGYLVIDQTEAMTTIDVNTGKFIGKKDQQKTLLRVNLEAANALARQLRVRNLGGIIIIDFIDMKNAEDKAKVMECLERALAKDSAKITMTELSQLGLVEMTRKRTTESLENLLCEPCNICEGRGRIKTRETICYEVFRDVLRKARQYDHLGCRVVVSQKVFDYLLDEEASTLADIETLVKKPISIEVDLTYEQEQFDVIPG